MTTLYISTATQPQFTKIMRSQCYMHRHGSKLRSQLSKQCAATASPSQSQRFEGNNKTLSPFPKKPPTTSPSRSSKKKTLETPPLLSDAFLNNPDLSPFLLRLAHDTIASGDGPSKALNFAIRASKSFERCAVEGEPNLDLAISLHVLAAIYCSLGRFEEAVPVLKHSIQVPDIERAADHALAAFSSYMQLDDTFSMLD
ncbi:Protein KINESIN LIGHT CHAIN-RELATED 1 [Glycine soja]